VMQQIRSGQPLRGYLAADAGLTWARAQAIWDSPDKASVESGEIPGRLFLRRFVAEAAKVKTELDIVSPYFVPGQTGTEIIENLRKRGVRVRVLTNSLSSTDVPAVHAGYMRYRRELL